MKTCGWLTLGPVLVLFFLGLFGGCEGKDDGPSASSEQDCKDQQDNDSDGKVDCDDPDCAGAPDCIPEVETNCQDQKDEDLDGKTDCDDSDCAQQSLCLSVETDCMDQKDNDADELTDCSDPDCDDFPICQAPAHELWCKDHLDNDQDGAEDCADADCLEARCCTAPDAGDGRPGSSCWVDEDCLEGGSCWTVEEQGFPGGCCVISGCSSDSCPEGSRCVKGSTVVSNCLQACEDNSNCRQEEGYVCNASKVCWPGTGTVPPGGSCASDQQCMGGEDAVCIQQAGFVGGYCTQFSCKNDQDCPGGGTCRKVGSQGAMVCVDPCESTAECRLGYACIDNSNSTWYHACYPGCLEDNECPGKLGCRLIADFKNMVCVDVSHECSKENQTGDCPSGKICNQGVCEDFQCQDNLLEPNESQDQAAQLPQTLTAGFQICSGDKDWYTFSPNLKDTLYLIGIDSIRASGDLEIELMDSEGKARDCATIEADDYHPENAVGPTNLQIHGLIGAEQSQPVWFLVYGQNDAVNNYAVTYREVPWQDGPDCLALFSKEECLALTVTGSHDSNQLLVFPVGNPADAFNGNSVFFSNGLFYVGGPEFTSTATLWGKREVLMIVRNAIHEVQQAFPETSPLGIGDIGLPDGTTPNGHPNGTHYYGSNMDIAYFIRPEYLGEYGNMTYRQICCDAPMDDWSCVEYEDTSSADYGTCVPGSESTHIVDLPRTAMLLAKIAGSGRLRVVGVEAKIEAGIKTTLDDLVNQSLISSEERRLVNYFMATANDDGSWIWHFNHMHASFEIGLQSRATEGSTSRGPWLEGTAEEQAAWAREFVPRFLPQF